MPKRFNWSDVAIIVPFMLFAVVISLFHLSDEDGIYLGLPYKSWKVIWAIAENGLLLSLFLALSFYTVNPIRTICRYVFIPYVLVKLVYQFSTFSRKFIVSEQKWEDIWSVICVFVILGSLFFVLIRKENAP